MLYAFIHYGLELFNQFKDGLKGKASVIWAILTGETK